MPDPEALQVGEDDLPALRVQAREAYDAAVAGAISRKGVPHDLSAADALVELPLTASERRLLWCGVRLLFSGPAQMTDEVARVVGFSDAADFKASWERLSEAVKEGQPLRPRDWHRVVATTEIGFSSVTVGAAWDWYPVTGINEEAALLLLRAVQSKALATIRESKRFIQQAP